jgi:citrate lyase subunit gamma (acyl carrier protein)
MLQFEEDITSTIEKVLNDMDIQDVHLIAKDKGALTPTIKARVETAVKRSLGIQEGTM